jgi:hypothetical protein
MNNIIGLSAQQLRQAADLQEQIHDLQAKLNTILGGEVSAPALGKAPKKRRMSAAGRAAIRAAQKARWAAIKGKQSKPAKKAKRKLTPAMKAALEKAWAARRAKKA